MAHGSGAARAPRRADPGHGYPLPATTNPLQQCPGGKVSNSSGGGGRSCSNISSRGRGSSSRGSNLSSKDSSHNRSCSGGGGSSSRSSSSSSSTSSIRSVNSFDDYSTPPLSTLFIWLTFSLLFFSFLFFLLCFVVFCCFLLLFFCLLVFQYQTFVQSVGFASFVVFASFFSVTSSVYVDENETFRPTINTAIPDFDSLQVCFSDLPLLLLLL